MFAEVTGKDVNRGAGYGLEVPCVFCLYGPKTYIEKMKAFIDTFNVWTTLAFSSLRSIDQ